MMRPFIILDDELCSQCQLEPKAKHNMLCEPCRVVSDAKFEKECEISMIRTLIQDNQLPEAMERLLTLVEKL